VDEKYCTKRKERAVYVRGVRVLQNQTMINTPERATIEPTTDLIETCSPLSIPMPRANSGEVARRV